MEGRRGIRTDLFFIMDSFQLEYFGQGAGGIVSKNDGRAVNGLEKVALWQRFDRCQPLAGMSDVRAKQIGIVRENLAAFTPA